MQRILDNLGINKTIKITTNDLNQFIQDNYDNIILIAKQICKGSPESEDVAHFAIESFIQHERGQELVDAGKAMNFISGIIHRSFHSSTSQYHTLYRQKGRVHGIQSYKQLETEDIDYNHEKDIAIEAIQGILEDMKADSIELWFRSTLFEMWIDTPNFSELARKTGIPRTSISKAVDEARDYIQFQLKINNIDYDE